MSARLSILLLCLCAMPATAQSKPGDELVTVPKRYVSAEGLSHSDTSASTDRLSSYAGIGKEVGEATKEALNSVVDVSDKFSKTEVGHFVMFMVAWHILGNRLFAVVIGLPLFVAGAFLWLYIFRRIFMSRRELIKNDKTAKVKEWKLVGPYEFESGDAKIVAVFLFVGTLAAWSIGMLNVIF